MGDLISKLGPREAGAAVIPRDTESKELLGQLRASPSEYSGVIEAALRDPRMIELYHMNPRAGAALGQLAGREQTWGAAAYSPEGGGKPQVYITPATSSMFEAIRQPNHPWMGRVINEAPPVEKTTAHELGHVVGGPVARDLEYRDLDSEIIADLVALNPTTSELAQLLNGDEKLIAQYGDVLHGALGSRARVLSRE